MRGYTCLSQSRWYRSEARSLPLVTLGARRAGVPFESDRVERGPQGGSPPGSCQWRGGWPACSGGCSVVHRSASRCGRGSASRMLRLPAWPAAPCSRPAAARRPLQAWLLPLLRRTTVAEDSATAGTCAATVPASPLNRTFLKIQAQLKHSLRLRASAHWRWQCVRRCLPGQ
jgi:hypothetical protein